VSDEARGWTFFNLLGSRGVVYIMMAGEIIGLCTHRQLVHIPRPTAFQINRQQTAGRESNPELNRQCLNSIMPATPGPSESVPRVSKLWIKPLTQHPALQADCRMSSSVNGSASTDRSESGQIIGRGQKLSKDTRSRR
jgi:hypothetical protein